MIDFSEFEDIALLILHGKKKIFATSDPASTSHKIESYLSDLIDIGYSFEMRDDLWPRRILKKRIGLSTLILILWSTGEAQQVFFVDEPHMVACG